MAIEMALVAKTAGKGRLGNGRPLGELAAGLQDAAGDQIGMRGQPVPLPEGTDEIGWIEPGLTRDIVERQRFTGCLADKAVRPLDGIARLVAGRRRRVAIRPSDQCCKLDKRFGRVEIITLFEPVKQGCDDARHMFIVHHRLAKSEHCRGWDAAQTGKGLAGQIERVIAPGTLFN